MIIYKRLEVTWENGTVEVFPKAVEFSITPAGLIVNSHNDGVHTDHYMRLGNVKGVKVS